MKINILYIFLLIIGLSCKKDNKGSELKNDRFTMPSMSGDYEPKGLRKMGIVEMKQLVETGGIPSGIVYKNSVGEVVSSDYYSNGPEPRFMQMYANSTGKVEEAVIHEMTPELKAIMQLMRMATMPVE